MRTHQLQEACTFGEGQGAAAGEGSEASAPLPFHPPELAIIVPTLNERDNLEELLRRLDVALDGLSWEVILSTMTPELAASSYCTG